MTRARRAAIAARILGCAVLAAACAHPQVAPAQTRAAVPRTGGQRFWIAAGVAGASLLTGVVLDRLAVADLEAYRRAPSPELRHRGERKALVSDLAFGAVGLAGLIAVVLFVVDRPCADPASPTAGPITVPPSGLVVRF